MLDDLKVRTELQKLEDELRRTQRDMEVLKRELRLLREGKAEKEPRWVNVTGNCKVTGVIFAGTRHQQFTIEHLGQLIGEDYRVRLRRFPHAPGSLMDPGFMWDEALIVERRVEE